MLCVARALAAGAVAFAVAPRETLAQAQAGWTMTTVTTLDSGPPTKKQTTTMRLQSVGEKARMSVSSSSLPESAGGMYMLMGAADGTMTSVMPASGMATISNLPTAGNFVKMQRVSSSEGEVVDLGPGDTILGFATHHSRVASTIVMRAWVYGDSCTHTARSVMDSWSSPAAGVPSMSGHFMNYFSGTAVDTAKSSAAKALLRRQLGGDALKTVTVTRRAATSGDSTTVTSTMEITELAHGEIDLSVFEVPAGVNVMDTRPMMEAMQKQPDFQQKVASMFRKTWCDTVPR